MIIRNIRLDLFDGAAASGEASSSGNAAQTTGDIVYGKQESAAPSEAEKNPAAGEVTKANTQDDKRKAFQDLVRGEYKDQYTEATQAIIDKRFKEHKALQGQLQAVQPLVDMLAQKYHVAPSDLDGLSKAIESDDSYWADAADEAGMTVEQYKEYSKVKRENEALRSMQQQAQNKQRADMQVQKWVQEADAVKQRFPKFDLQTETQNPQFLSMLKAGVPMEHAYKVMHFDDMMKDNITATAAYTQQAVVDNVRARGSRPQENGASSQSAAIIKDDVSKLSKKDRAEIARRAKHGAQITF